MTRINCVPPKELHRKHLAAEHYELPRVFTQVRKCLEKGVDPRDIKAPDQYTLGKGHLKFFYTRLGYLQARMADLIAEMILRGMKPNIEDVGAYTRGIPQHLLGNWTPTKEAMKLNRARLEERLAEMEAKPKRKVPSHKD